MEHLICGYGRYGDSTGLVLFSVNSYDPRGCTKLEVSSEKIIMEADLEEPISSWFYDTRHHVQRNKDSTWYKYDSKGRLVEYQWYNALNGKRKTVYSYDASGRCVKAQNYQDGKISSTESFVYDQSGRLVKSTVMEGQVKTSWSTIEYDTLGREVRKITYVQVSEKITADTFVTVYGTNTVTRSGKFYSSHETTTTVFTEYDSVAAVYSSQKYGNYDPFFDTTVYTRDAVTHHRISSVKRTKYGTTTINYAYKMGKLDSVITMYEGQPTQIVTYDSSGHVIRREYYVSGKLKSIDTWHYNTEGDLSERRLLSPTGKLVQREVYRYTYY